VANEKNREQAPEETTEQSPEQQQTVDDQLEVAETVEAGLNLSPAKGPRLD
jgi:hypothetical protein